MACIQLYVRSSRLWHCFYRFLTQGILGESEIARYVYFGEHSTPCFLVQRFESFQVTLWASLLFSYLYSEILHI